MHDPHDLPLSEPASREPRDVAAAFARALDEGDLGRVGRLLSPECECRDGALCARGAEAVLALYRAAASWTERGFDDVRHVSQVAEVAGTQAHIEVTSMLMRMPGRWHRLRYAREIAIGRDGHIATIAHACESGAAEAFRVFVRDCEVPSPPPGFGV